MEEFNIFGPLKKGSKKKEQNIFNGGLNFGLTSAKKQKNPLDFGFGPLPKKEIKRDSRRGFTKLQQEGILKQQNYKCASCKKKFKVEERKHIEFDHIKPWADSGKTITENGQALHLTCHKDKSDEEKLKKIDKKRKPKNSNIFGGNIFGPPPKRSKNNPWGL